MEALQRRRQPRSVLAPFEPARTPDVCSHRTAFADDVSPHSACGIAQAPVSHTVFDLNTFFLFGSGFIVFHVNARSINSDQRRAALHVFLDEHAPDFLAVTETWLEVSTTNLEIVGMHQCRDWTAGATSQALSTMVAYSFTARCWVVWTSRTYQIP